MLLEVRAVLRGHERIAITELGRNLRQLMLCDILELTLAIERGRSGSYKLLVVIRRTAGLCLARNIRLPIRCKASDTNAPDGRRSFEPRSHSCLRQPWNVVLVGSHFSEGFLSVKKRMMTTEITHPDF